MKFNIKKLVSSLLVIAVITSILPVTVYADGFISDSSGSTGSGSGSVGGKGTYSQNQEGFRISLVDKNFNQVSNTVDVLFQEPPSGAFGRGNKDLYTNTRTNGLTNISADRCNWGYITLAQLQKSIDNNSMWTNPLPPVYSPKGDGKLAGQGEDFKKWFIKGAEGTYEPPSNAIGNNGGTTNVVEDNEISKDIGPVNHNKLLTDTDYRMKVGLEAYGFVQKQGLFNHAIKIASSEIEYTINIIGYLISKGYSGRLVLETVFKGELNYCYNVGLSNAEAIYMFIIIINNIFGSDEVYNDISIVGMDLNKPEFENKEFTGNTNTLEKIPLAGNESGAEVGWWTAILNAKQGTGNNKQYIFKFLPSATGLSTRYSPVITDTDRTYISSTASASGYYILVEPIFWLVPAAYGGGPVHGNYVYGTINNFVDFYAANGYRYGTDAGNYVTVTCKIGWQAFYYYRDVPGTTFPKSFNAADYASRNGDKQLLPTLKSWKDDTSESPYGWGFGMHIYSTSTNDIIPKDQVTGASGWTAPQTAPDSNPPVKTYADGTAMQNTEGYAMRADGTVEPDYKFPPSGYKKEYNIVKYYEDVSPDGTVEQVGKFLRKDNPPNIAIVDEANYKVVDYFTSTTDVKDFAIDTYGIFSNKDDGADTYNDAKASMTVRRTGKQADGLGKPILLDEERATETNQANREKTLVVLLQQKLATEAEAPLTLQQSQISKAITTMDTVIDGWGPRNFTFSYKSMEGNDEHADGKTGNETDGYKTRYTSCTARFGDSSYSYVITNSAALDAMLEANAAGGKFASKLLNNTKSGSASLGGGTNSLDSAEYQTTIWRGQDVPTIASYRESSSIELNSLLAKYGKVPVGDRHSNGTYGAKLNIQLTVDESASDLETHSVHSFNGSSWVSAHHDWLSLAPHNGDVAVRVYRGNNNKEVGNETSTSEIPTNTPFGNTNSIHSAGYMVQAESKIYFYPYLRMTYQVTGDTTKNEVDILSQFYSEILPSDFAEAAWYNSNEDTSLTLSSLQWSLHAGATSGDKSWNKPNQVLPGGAVFQLSTGDSPTKLGLVTWQTIMDEKERSALAKDLPANAYTLNKANTEHSKYVEQAKQVIEGLRVVQWVNSNVKATNAWDNSGGAIKITDGGQDLSSIGSSQKTSQEAKYRFGKDGSGDAANEGDLDVISQSDSTDTFFKLFSDVRGNVYMAKSIGNMDSLKDLNGDNVGNAVKILTQSNKADSIDSKLTGDAKELNTRTKAITNFVKAIERGTGNDTSASWVSNGKWYNEAWDGLYVVRKASILDVGFANPGTRSAALDSVLGPKSTGVADMFSKANVSQFRVAEKSDADIAKNKGNGYIGSFQGKDIRLPDMENMYHSKKFYIPNVTVQDLG